MLGGGRIDGQSFTHGFAHADGPGNIVTAGLDELFLFRGDLLDLAVDCICDCIEKSLIANGSVGVGGANFILNGDKGLVTKFDLAKKRLPVHFEGNGEEEGRSRRRQNAFEILIESTQRAQSVRDGNEINEAGWG